MFHQVQMIFLSLYYFAHTSNLWLSYDSSTKIQQLTIPLLVNMDGKLLVSSESCFFFLFLAMSASPISELTIHLCYFHQAKKDPKTGNHSAMVKKWDEWVMVFDPIKWESLIFINNFKINLYPIIPLMSWIDFSHPPIYGFIQPDFWLYSRLL